MKRINITNSITGRSYGQVFETQEELDAWKNDCLAKDVWGKPERWIKDIDNDTLTLEEKNSSLDSRLVELHEEYDEIEYDIISITKDENDEPVINYNLDENGDRIILSQETIPAVTCMEYLLPCEYTITEEGSDNGYFDIQNAYSDLRDARDKCLAETDFTQLPDAPVDTTLRSRYVEYRTYLRALPSNYTDQNITSFEVMTFSEWRSQMYPAD